jgi:hypothetical protein
MPKLHTWTMLGNIFAFETLQWFLNTFSYIFTNENISGHMKLRLTYYCTSYINKYNIHTYICTLPYTYINLWAGRSDVRGSNPAGDREFFFYNTVSRTALGSTQTPIQWVPGALSLEVKRPGREGDHSLRSNAQVKNTWSYTSTPPYTITAWFSVKAQGQLYLTLCTYLATCVTYTYAYICTIRHTLH